MGVFQIEPKADGAYVAYEIYCKGRRISIQRNSEDAKRAVAAYQAVYNIAKGAAL